MQKSTLLATIAVFGILSAAIGACCMPLTMSNMSESHCATEQNSDSPKDSCCLVHAVAAESVSKALAGPESVDAAALSTEASAILDSIPQAVPQGALQIPSSRLGSIHEICVLRI